MSTLILSIIALALGALSFPDHRTARELEVDRAAVGVSARARLTRASPHRARSSHMVPASPRGW
jgi:hypothetical protein